jgi:poly(3-hydroxybutyrate) depolymerase
MNNLARQTRFLVILAGIILGAAVYCLIAYGGAILTRWKLEAGMRDQGTYLVYRPEGLDPHRKHPLVFALSPGADAQGMVVKWLPVADKHGWIVAASKEFHNGQDFYTSLDQLKAELDGVEKNGDVDPCRVILTGISGGGMGAHAVAHTYPDLVSAVVINTGMMADGFMTADYPEGKLAVFLASPTDFRYTEMKRDRAFLEAHRWTTLWIEFAGGHTLAPDRVYEQAAAWLEKQFLGISC